MTATEKKVGTKKKWYLKCYFIAAKDPGILTFGGMLKILGL